MAIPFQQSEFVLSAAAPAGFVRDGRRQLAAYQRESNDHIMTCLGMKSPKQVLALYQGVMW